ncbi:helix-turn-helix domain-containing protein [Kitasatospora kifunensis]|uniref:Transcriptional regulator with XRE-family HTH domain n=1 Tax=Kitasatospora kifunensis TaxID=58351 RepID=A0A7W7R6R5_KITKI|nr:helix-turn-helix transcriptional regulator [Kitasatospora kifunensis]MBB4926394.1 transcriptional regulator with XRE-family HTH domain [Kitasatospora kifunensis]
MPDQIDREVGRRINRARLRKGWDQAYLGDLVGRSESWISKVERGQLALDSVQMAGRLAELLGVDAPHLLALDLRYPNWQRGQLPVNSHVPSRPTTAPGGDAEGEPVLRRAFALGTLAGLSSAYAALSPDARDQLAARTQRGRVDRRALRELGTISRSIRRAYSSFPARALLPVAHDQIELALSLRPREQPQAERFALLNHMAEMAALAGGMLTLDLGDFEGADAYMTFAQQLARETGNAEIRALILGGRAFVESRHGGDQDDALDFALAAVDHAGRGASVRTRAWTHAVCSEMYASCGDEAGFRSALDTARTLLSGPVDDDHRWSGFSWFDLSKADGYEGGDLVAMGRWREALPALDQALQRLPEPMLRHRGTAHVGRAEAYAGAGEVVAACADGHAALDLVAQVQHKDTLRRVTQLHRSLRASAPSPAVRALGEHVLDIRTIVKTSKVA